MLLGGAAAIAAQRNLQSASVIASAQRQRAHAELWRKTEYNLDDADDDDPYEDAETPIEICCTWIFNMLKSIVEPFFGQMRLAIAGFIGGVGSMGYIFGLLMLCIYLYAVLGTIY